MHRRPLLPLAAGLVLVLSLAACGSSPAARPAAPAPVETAVSIAGPTGLALALQQGEVHLTWDAPATPFDAFDVYVDQFPPVRLPAPTREYSLGVLPQGSQHFVQVVARNGDTTSDPVVASYAVPYAAKPPQAEAVEEPAAPPVRRVTTAAAGAGAISDPAAADAGTFLVRGTMSMSSVISRDLDPQVQCDVDPGLRLEVKDAAGSIVGLAELSKGRASDIEQDEYSTSWLCDFPYSIRLGTSSPVYTFRAYYENLPEIKPWSTTVGLGQLRSKPPSPYLSFCTC